MAWPYIRKLSKCHGPMILTMGNAMIPWSCSCEMQKYYKPMIHGYKINKTQTVKTAHDPSDRAIGQSSLIFNHLWGGGEIRSRRGRFQYVKKIKNKTPPLGHQNHPQGEAIFRGFASSATPNPCISHPFAKMLFLEGVFDFVILG